MYTICRGLNVGILYTIEILLELKYEKNNIDYFFQKCLENNICLYSDTFDNVYELDSSGAATQMLRVEIDDEKPKVHAKFQDTDFFIWIYKEKNNLISFFIGDFGIIWRKKFINYHYNINFARYIRLLLRVCRNFTILELKTDTF